MPQPEADEFFEAALPTSKPPAPAHTEADESPETGKLWEAVGAAWKTFGEITMDQVADVRSKKGDKASYRYPYLSLPALNAEVRPKLINQGVWLDESVTDMGDGILCTLTLRHWSSGQWRRTGITMFPEDRSHQARGSAISYGRRYLILSACGVAAARDDDDGRRNAERVRGKAEPARKLTRDELREAASAGGPPITEPQAKRLYAIAMQAGWSRDGFQDETNFLTSGQTDLNIPKGAYDDVVAYFEAGPQPPPGSPAAKAKGLRKKKDAGAAFDRARDLVIAAQTADGDLEPMGATTAAQLLDVLEKETTWSAPDFLERLGEALGDEALAVEDLPRFVKAKGGKKEPLASILLQLAELTAPLEGEVVGVEVIDEAGGDS